jgi:hypothetical protein
MSISMGEKGETAAPCHCGCVGGRLGEVCGGEGLKVSWIFVVGGLW